MKAIIFQVIVYIDADVCASQVIQRFVGRCQTTVSHVSEKNKIFSMSGKSLGILKKCQVILVI